MYIQDACQVKFIDTQSIIFVPANSAHCIMRQKNDELRDFCIKVTTKCLLKQQICIISRMSLDNKYSVKLNMQLIY